MIRQKITNKNRKLQTVLAKDINIEIGKYILPLNGYFISIRINATESWANSIEMVGLETR